MRRVVILALLFSSVSAAKVNVSAVAAVSTIAVNVLDIKATFAKTRKVASGVKKTAGKVAKKVTGK